MSGLVLFEHKSPPGSSRARLGAVSLSLQCPLRHNPFLGGRALTPAEGEQLPCPGLCFAFPAVMFNICHSIHSALGTGEFVLMDGLGIACAEMACCCKRLFLFLGVEKLPLW